MVVVPELQPRRERKVVQLPPLVAWRAPVVAQLLLSSCDQVKRLLKKFYAVAKLTKEQRDVRLVRLKAAALV